MNAIAFSENTGEKLLRILKQTLCSRWIPGGFFILTAIFYVVTNINFVLIEHKASETAYGFGVAVATGIVWGLGNVLLASLMLNQEQKKTSVYSWNSKYWFVKAWSDGFVKKASHIWLVYSPGFFALIMCYFLFYPTSGELMLVDGERVTSFTWTNPRTSEIILLKRDQPMYLAKTLAKTKDGFLVSANVKADLVVTDDMSKWVPDAEMKKRAEQAVTDRFERTIAGKSLVELEHLLPIEASVGTSRNLAKDGLEWKQGSTIEVSAIHAVAGQ